MTEPKNIKTCTFCKAEFDDFLGEEVCLDCFKQCEMCQAIIEPDGILCEYHHCMVDPVGYFIKKSNDNSNLIKQLDEPINKLNLLVEEMKIVGEKIRT